MIKNTLRVVAAFLALGLAGPSQSATPQQEELITKFLAARQALVLEKKVDVAELSKAIREAVNGSERLEREGNYQSALNKLLELEKYCPLMELPSFDVQMLSSWLYGKLGDSNKANAYKTRAEAMRQLLWERIGKGDTPVDPIQALMVNDITEWSRSRLAKISAVKSYPYQGKELQVITYSGPSTGGQPKIAYFEIDRRVQAKANQQIRLYAAIPLASMRSEDLRMLDLAKQKRDNFLNDDRLPYLELVAKVRDSIRKAAELDLQGKPAEALAKLKEIEVIRPIEDIPLPNLIGLYSALNGKVGNTEKQIDLRRLLFGINQIIAHSGDGLSPETAVHVIATTEEYGWLGDNKLTMIRQRVLDTSNDKFDVLSTKDTSGIERDYYFNITRMYLKYSQGMSQSVSKP